MIKVAVVFINRRFARSARVLDIAGFWKGWTGSGGEERGTMIVCRPCVRADDSEKPDDRGRILGKCARCGRTMQVPDEFVRVEPARQAYVLPDDLEKLQGHGYPEDEVEAARAAHTAWIEEFEGPPPSSRE